MDAILEQAQTLARQVAADPRTQALRAARERLLASPADAELQQRYHQAARQVAELEDRGAPIEPPLKRELAALVEQVRRSPVLQTLLRAHAEFEALMEGVSTTLSTAVDAALGVRPASDAPAPASDAPPTSQAPPASEVPTA